MEYNGSTACSDSHYKFCPWEDYPQGACGCHSSCALTSGRSRWGNAVSGTVSAWARAGSIDAGLIETSSITGLRTGSATWHAHKPLLFIETVCSPSHNLSSISSCRAKQCQPLGYKPHFLFVENPALKWMYMWSGTGKPYFYSSYLTRYK